MILRKRTLKFKLMKRYKMSDSLFLRIRVEGLRGTTWEEENVPSLRVFIILLKLTSDQGKPDFLWQGKGGRGE